MAEDFAYILADVAALLGVKLFSSLPANEQAQLKAVTNEGYREHFLRPNGKRVRWAEDYIPFQLPAPLSFTFTATQGATTIGSPSVSLSAYANFVGSRVRIGTVFHTLATVSALLEPYAGATGVVSATLFFSSYVLPLENIDVSEEPEVLGWGRLAPMASRGQEIRNRTFGTGDFVPETGAPWNASRFSGFGAQDQTGDPLFYVIDSASLVGAGAAASMQNRFNVYPLPDGSNPRTLRVRGNYVPLSLSADADLPRLPTNVVIDTLLPIVRAKVVAVSRRFNGPNRAEIIAAGQVAQAKLDALGNAQKRKPTRMRLKGGW